MLVEVKELDHHVDLASVELKFHGTVAMVFLNMFRHVSMTHMCHMCHMCHYSLYDAIIAQSV